MPLKINLLTLLLCASATTVALAQVPDLRFHHLSPSEGLSQSVGAYVSRDSRGFVWISSTDGLNRFDGMQVKIYRANETDPNSPLGKNILSRTYEDANGDLWFTTERGLNRYNRSTDNFSHFRWPLQEKDGQAVHIHIYHYDTGGRLWVTDGGNTYLFQTPTHPASNAPVGWLKAVGNVDGWPVTPHLNTNTNQVAGFYGCYNRRKGVADFRFVNDTLIQQSTLFDGSQPNQPALQVSSVLPIGEGDLWFCAEGSLYFFNLKAKQPPLAFNRFGNTTVQNAVQVKAIGEQYLLVSTDGQGLFLFDLYQRKFVQQYRHDESDGSSLASDRASEIFYDADQQMLWISLWNVGVDFTHWSKTKFNQVRLARQTQHSSLLPFVPQFLAPAPNNNIWCADARGGGLLLLNQEGQVVRDYSEQVQGAQWMVPGPNNYTFLLGLDYTVRVLNASSGNPPKASAVLEAQGPYPAFLTDLVATTRGGVFATDGDAGRLFRLREKNGVWRTEPLTTPALDTLSPGRMYEDRQGQFYAEALSRGLFVSRSSPPNVASGKFIPLNGDVRCFAENDSCVWVGGSFGLLCVNKQTFDFQLFNEKFGVPPGIVNAVLAHRNEALWLSGTTGLLRYDLASRTCTSFELADGLQSTEFNAGSCLATPDGRFWFGGIRGLNVFNPDNIAPVRNLARPMLTRVLVNDQPLDSARNVTELNTLRLPYYQNTLTLDFAALEFSDPANNQLHYQLLRGDSTPIDTAWVEYPGRTGLRLPRLNPGHYLLRVRATNSDGLSNPAYRYLDIRISPPYWQTWWFRGLCLVALAAAAYAFYRYRLAQVRRQEGFKRRIAESEMSALLAQLNPHFVSNSLNSISAYILRGDNPGALGYVADFAALTRIILDNSRRATVPLEDEIEVLGKFLEVEVRRFVNLFRYEIEVDETEVDPFDTRIPPMLLQPFVENAILHGLHPKTWAAGETGLIRIRMDRSGQALRCVISDNGRGLPANFDPGKPSQDGKAHALQINLERLKIYDENNKTHSSLTFENSLGEQGEVLGARVTLLLGPPDYNA